MLFGWDKQHDYNIKIIFLAAWSDRPSYKSISCFSIQFSSVFFSLTSLLPLIPPLHLWELAINFLLLFEFGKVELILTKVGVVVLGTALVTVPQTEIDN